MLMKDARVRHTPEFPTGDGTTMAMAERPTSYDYEALLTCGRGELFGRGNAQLPLPPMLMFDRIASISETGGAHGKGQIVAELNVCGNPCWIGCGRATSRAIPSCRVPGLDALGS
jgi:3-hydroxyacyl-[acyl-carrier protein] dehydratase/trans-2-decenoyl-[acyl-carrier protein] isomerase